MNAVALGAMGLGVRIPAGPCSESPTQSSTVPHLPIRAPQSASHPLWVSRTRVQRLGHVNPATPLLRCPQRPCDSDLLAGRFPDSWGLPLPFQHG